MPIYDRDYYRREEPRPYLSLPRSMVATIIIINVVLWVADFCTPVTKIDPDTGQIVGRWLSDHLAVHIYTIKPWYWWQYLTAGFAHSPQVAHILGNMLVLFFLGRDIEGAYGSREFLRFYLATVVLGNVMWNMVALFFPHQGMAAYGASGAITGVVVLYALNFPHRTILFMFIIPMPAWVFGALVVGLDMFGALGANPGSNIAYPVHLAGAAFAFVYYRQRWNLTRLTEHLSLPRLPFHRKPRLRVHRPEEKGLPESELSQEVDRILEKISREGEAGLTAKERKTLETASREYQRKRRQ